MRVLRNLVPMSVGRMDVEAASRLAETHLLLGIEEEPASVGTDLDRVEFGTTTTPVVRFKGRSGTCASAVESVVTVIIVGKVVGPRRNSKPYWVEQY